MAMPETPPTPAAENTVSVTVTPGSFDDEVHQRPRNGLAALRIAQGWTVAGLADHLGMHRDSIVKWERGDRHPRGEALVKIARALKCSPEQVLAAMARGA